MKLKSGVFSAITCYVIEQKVSEFSSSDAMVRRMIV